jgi:copper chaperone CopZ
MVAFYNQSSTGSLQRLPGTFLATPSSFLRFPTFLENVQRTVPASLSSQHGVKHSELIAVAPESVQRSSKDQPVASSDLGSSGSSGMYMKYVVQIDGMACEACASRLRQYFSRQEGIERANVFFDEKKLVLWTQAGSGSIMLSERVIQDMVGQVDVKYRAKLEDIFSFSSMTPQ